MRLALAFAWLIAGCARPAAVSETDPVAVVAETRPSYFAAVDRAVADVDARRDAPRAEPHAFAPATVRAREERSERAERAVEPEAQPRAQAFEVDRPSGKVAIVSGAPKLSRFEAESLARKCERRPTRVSREWCLAGK